MKINKLVSLLSVAVIIGFIAGCINSIYHITINRYLVQNMHRLSVLSFEKYITRWIILVIAIAFAPTIILTLCQLIAKLINKFFFSNILKIQIKHTSKLRKRLLAAGICFIFFFYSVWTAERYGLRNTLKPLTILTNFVIPFLVIYFAWLLTKVNWEKLCKPQKLYRGTAIALVAILFILKVGNNIVSATNIPKGPNVILLVVDTWRADALGCYNEHTANTPNVDKFAANAVLFKHFIAQGSCTINSAPSILCSLYPYEHGYFNYNCVVPKRFNTIAELLRNDGYYTFGLSTNPHVTRRNGLEQGFDVFIEDMVWRDTDCSEVNKEFIKWFDKNRQKPFFAMLWYIDPHSPYDPPDEYKDKFITSAKERKLISRMKSGKNFDRLTDTEKKVAKKLYAGEVNFFDTEFAKLISDFKQRGIMENSIIILTSDHGESFWEKKNPLLKEIYGHGTSLFEEEISIPFIISLPNQQKGKIILQKAQHIDIVPTILDYTDSDSLNNLSFKGDSLKRLIDNDEVIKRYHFYSQSIVNQDGSYFVECVQTNTHKLVRMLQYEDVPFTPSHLSMLDLTVGESELDTTEKLSNELFKNLQTKLNTWPGNLQNVQLVTQQIKYEDKRKQEKMRERLKTLGYVE